MQSAVLGLLILALCVVLFLTNKISVAATGCLGCLLMVLTKVCSFNVAFGGFSSKIVMLMASAYIVGIAMFKTGAATVLGRFVMRYAKDEKVFLIISCAVFGLLSTFLANTALVAAYFPIADSVCRVSSMKRRNLILPVTCAIMLGGQSTLVGCTPQLAANAMMLNITGDGMTMWSLTGPGLSLLALYLAYLWFFGYDLGERIWGRRVESGMDVDPSKLKALNDKQCDRKKMIVMMAITALMILSYLVGFLPTEQTAMCAAILCILTGCCTTKDVVREMPWEVVIFLAACLGLADGLTESGAGALLGNWLSLAIGNISSPFLIFAVITALTGVISQFITNSTAIIIVMPFAMQFCLSNGFNPLPFTVGITIAASAACCSPLAAAQITMTQAAGYRFSDYMKYNMAPTLIFWVGTLVLVPLFVPLA